MVTWASFEELDAWKKARVLTREIYRATRRPGFNRDFDLQRQIRRAAISVMSNIAEGFGRRSDREFASFISIAHGSIAELQSQLFIALDQQYIDDRLFSSIYGKANEISRLLQGLSSYLRRAEKRSRSLGV